MWPGRNTTTKVEQWLDVRLVNPLNAELNPICHLLALAGAHHFVHVSRVRGNRHNKSCRGVDY